MTPNMADALYQAVQGRPRPEDVADLVVEVLGPTLTAQELPVLEQAARRALRRSAQRYTSMAQQFFRATTGVQRQVHTAATLLVAPVDLPQALTLAEHLDPQRVLEFVRQVGAVVGKRVGANDFRTDRILPKATRRQQGLYKNARWVNKRWRLLKTIEVKLARHAWNEQRYATLRMGKGGLAWTLTKDELTTDGNTACFAAYMTARLGLRSTFTNTSQVRAYDTIADLLFQRCVASPTTRWDILALILPDQKVLAHLDDTAKGRLLGRWHEELVRIASMLQVLWDRQAPVPDRATMIVKRGQDSSSWNEVAGGWNAARQHWMHTLHALGQESLLQVLCPGKVMRLMAADVARWHRLSGGDVHPATAVWAALPPPWEVVRGRVTCTAAQVTVACLAAAVNPKEWTGAAQTRQPVPFTPTPELVHGVAVTSPHLARVLRQLGYFSGKGVKGMVDDAEVVRDAHGFALGARPAVVEAPLRRPGSGDEE